MNRFALLIGILTVSQTLYAKSFEEELAAQVEVTVSPVSLNGVALFNGPSVCSALGYTRAISEITEPCLQGEVRYYYSSVTPGASVRLVKGFNCDLLKAGRDTKLNSVTCAK